MKYKIIVLITIALAFFSYKDVKAEETYIPCLTNIEESKLNAIALSSDNKTITGVNNDYYIIVRDYEDKELYRALTPDSSGNTYTLPASVTTNNVYYIYVYPKDNLLNPALSSSSNPNACKNDSALLTAPTDETRPYHMFEVYQVDTGSGNITDADKEYIYQEALKIAKEYTKDWAINYNDADTDSLEGNAYMCDPSIVDVNTTQTLHHKAETKVEGVTSCTVECVEMLTVEYGPPVALLAGMGFSYDITITSEVDCETRVNKDAIYKELEPDRNICIPTPICNNSSIGGGYTNSAGPTEDFESCIMSCDGGKYTEECSNICYDQVYNNQETNSLTMSENKLLTSPYFVAAPKSLSAVKSCSSYKAYIDTLSESVKGKFEASYAFYCSPSQIYTTNKKLSYYPSNFLFDSGGFLRNFNLWGTVCQAPCWWASCDGSKIGDLGEHTYTKDEQKEDFDIAAEDILKDIAACNKAADTMEETENSTYDPEITNRYEDKSGDLMDAGDNLDFSTEYERDEQEQVGDKKVLTYKFPESYTNLEGVVLYEINDNYRDWRNEIVDDANERFIEGNYKKTDHQYITHFSSVNTNKEWMLWYYEEPRPEKYTGQDPEYNILTELRNVGFFGWAIDVDCYYALHNPNVDRIYPPEPNIEDSNGGSSGTNLIGGGLDYVFRPIDLTNVFPNEFDDGSNINTRVPQWNWSDGAKVTTIADYVIDPVALTEKIESINYNAYEEKPDYTIKLDSRAISDIRAYNKDKGSYLNYDANCVDQIDGRTVCDSEFKYGGSSPVSNNSKVGCNNSLDNTTCEVIN